MTLQPLIGGIELGGTKCIALIAHGAEIVAQASFPTTAPLPTLSTAAAWLAAQRQLGEIERIGIASFGPVELDHAHPEYGRITRTTKPGWDGADVLGIICSAFAVPVAIDTDVNGAAAAEARWGGAQGCRVSVYLTIGTGVGGGVIVDGRIVNGLVHPEMGHVRVRRRADDGFAGHCIFHGDCLEGLAAGPAIAARTGQDGASLPAGHPVWTDVAGEIAELLTMLILTLGPQRIAIGGGVGQGQPHLLPMIRHAVGVRLGGYVPAIDARVLEDIIRHPALGDRAGPLGAIAVGLSETTRHR